MQGPRKYWIQNVWVKEILCPKNIGSRKSWVKNLYPIMFVSKKFKVPKIFWVQINFETSQTPSLYPPDMLSIPCRHQSDTFQTPFGHPPHTLKTPTKFQPSVLHKVGFSTRAGVGWVAGWVAEWVAGWVAGPPLQNHATLWSNLQDCKISSRAEIPKLDRVWQYVCIST